MARWQSHFSIRTRLFFAIALLFLAVMLISTIAISTLARTNKQLGLLHNVTQTEVSRALELSQSAATLSKSAPFLLTLNAPIAESAEKAEVFDAMEQLEALAIGDPELNLTIARMRAAVTELEATIPRQNKNLASISEINVNLENLLRRYRKWITTRDATTYERQSWSALQQLTMEAVGASRARTLISVGEFQRRYEKIRNDVLSAASPAVADLVQEIDQTITSDESLFALAYRAIATSLDAENALFRIRTEAERINSFAARKVDSAEFRLREVRAETGSNLTVAQYVIVALTLLSLIVALFSAAFVSRYVTGNLRRIAIAMQRLASGDRKTRLERIPETKDEIGQLFSAFRIFRANALRLDRKSQLIQRQNNLFSRVFENINDGVLITAATGRIEAENLRFRELLRLPPQAGETGESFDDLITSSAFNKKKTMNPSLGYVEYTNPAGHILEMRSSPFPEGGAVYLFSEVTERRRLDERLEEIRRVETLGKVAGEVAHDFGNILSTVLGNLHLLETSPPDASAKILGRISNAVDMGVTLTERLLAFASKQQLAPQKTDIAELVMAMKDLLEVALPTEIELLVTEPDGPMFATIDPGQLESAVLNLCINAAQAISGKGHIRISFQRTDESFIALTVSDDGPGMSQETLRSATEPFYSARRGGGGTGLGLSMVYGFVHQSGGSMEIASTLDVGTTVTLIFPTTSQERREFQVPSHLGKALVIDDDPVAMTATVSALTQSGFSVVEAPNFENGREKLLNMDELSLVLVDLKLDNNQSGWDLIKLALQRRENQQIVAMSTQLPSHNPVNPSDHHRFATLSKPITPDALMDVLDFDSTAGTNRFTSTSDH